MKTQVVINKETIRKYYKDIFIANYLALEIIVLLAGGFGLGYYATKGNVIGGIGLFAIGLFVMLIIFYMNHNAMKAQINELADTERSYIVEFTDSEILVGYNDKNASIPYDNLKIRKLTSFYQFRLNEKNSRVSIVPKTAFNEKEWEEIAKKINKIYYAKKNKKEAEVDVRNDSEHSN